MHYCMDFITSCLKIILKQMSFINASQANNMVIRTLEAIDLDAIFPKDI